MKSMKKTSIRALILDYGGVISRPQDPRIVNTLICTLDVEPEAFETAYRSYRATYDSGHKTGAEYWQSVLKSLDIDPGRIDISTLIRLDVESWTRINDSMIRFISGIRSRIDNLSIISNMTDDTLSFLRNGFNWLELFDALIFSCEFGVNKPDMGIYRECLKKIEIPPAECLFVDDAAENIEGAAAAGMHTIHYSSFDTFMADFNEKFGLRPVERIGSAVRG